MHHPTDLHAIIANSVDVAGIDKDGKIVVAFMVKLYFD
jgi:hypothetical protein